MTQSVTKWHTHAHPQHPHAHTHKQEALVRDTRDASVSPSDTNEE